MEYLDNFTTARDWALSPPKRNPDDLSFDELVEDDDLDEDEDEDDDEDEDEEESDVLDDDLDEDEDEDDLDDERRGSGRRRPRRRRSGRRRRRRRRITKPQGTKSQAASPKVHKPRGRLLSFLSRLFLSSAPPSVPAIPTTPVQTTPASPGSPSGSEPRGFPPSTTRIWLSTPPPDGCCAAQLPRA